MNKNMKPSGIEWIGDIPSDWEVKPIKYAVIINSKALLETTHNDYEFKYIDIGSVTYEYGITSYEETNFENAPSRARRIVTQNDIIISTVRTYLKAIARIIDDKNVIVSTGFAVFTPKYFNSIFLEFLCKSEYFCQEIDKQAWGIAYPAINSSQLGAIKIILPPISEQQAIANLLDEKCSKTDDIILDLQKQIEILKQYKKSLITETVTKGLDKTVPMKDSGIEWIGEIPEHWEVKRLKYCFKNFDSLRQPIEACERSQDSEILYDYYGASGIIDKIDSYIFNETLLLIGEDGANLVLRNLPLIYIAKGKYWVNNHAHILKPNSDNDLYYMAHQMEIKDYSNFITGSAQPKLSQQNLNNVILITPDINEQINIGQYLNKKCTTIDTIISEKEKTIETMQSYKKSLIYEYVTGKKQIQGEQ